MIVIGNVGDYDHPTDCNQTSGGSFVETAQAPGISTLGIVILLIALGLVSVFFAVRRFRTA